MEDEQECIAPSIDYSSFPQEMAGKWVIVRKSSQQPIGTGDTLEAAILDARLGPGEHGIAIGRVPLPHIDVF